MNDGASLHNALPKSSRRWIHGCVLVATLLGALVALAIGIHLTRARIAVNVTRVLTAHPDRMQVEEARWLPGQPARFRLRLRLDRKDGGKIGPSFGLELRDPSGGPLRLPRPRIRYRWTHNPSATAAITATTVTLDGACQRIVPGPTPISVCFHMPGTPQPDRWEALLPPAWRHPHR